MSETTNLTTFKIMANSLHVSTKQFLFLIKIAITLILFIAFTSILLAQNDFRKVFKALDPAPTALDLTPEEELVRHLSFLDSMRTERDSMGQLIGNLYVFLDQMRMDEYAEATPYLLRAESIAEKSGKKDWMGACHYHRGYLNKTLRNYPEALESFLAAAKDSELVSDSLFMAECYEQISVMHGKFREFEKAETYLAKALPILENLGDDDHLGIAYNNYGSLLFLQKKYDEAIVYTRKSMELHEKTGRKRSWIKAKHNLANNQRKIGKVTEAITGFKECIDFNRENDFRNNIIQNYAGLRAAYASIGDYESAYQYFRKYTALKDSINGEKTEQKIAALTLKFNENKYELEAEKEKVKLVAAKESLRRTLTILLGIALATLIGIISWIRQNRRSKLKFEENSKKLASLTRLLIEKNSAIKEMMDQRKESDVAAGSPSTNVFEQTILTNTDWQEFKTFFESKYPGYIFKLRKAYPELTEAEERLFLLIKTNLNTKEIAALLGISNSSVKKSRNRLRRKLRLSPDASLEEVIHSFESLRDSRFVLDTTE